MNRFSLGKIFAMLGEKGGSSRKISTFQIDSRKVSSGALFFALKGEKSDGHLFLEEVAQKGGIGAIVHQDYKGPSFGLELIYVENVLEALQQLARWDVDSTGVDIVGITGSVGKTTTKEFVATFLESSYPIAKTPGNYNTKLTLPLSVLNRKGDEKWLVLEMGMEEPKDILKLVRIAPPKISLLTEVALAHAAYFPKGLEQIAENKADIFLSEKIETAIYPKELKRFSSLVEKIPRGKGKSFSLHDEKADFFLDRSGAFFSFGKKEYQFDLPFQEEHLLHNLLAAIVTSLTVGLSLEKIAQRLSFLKTPSMRMEKKEKEKVLYIHDAYNANPSSMKAAFKAISLIAMKGKKIGVLGEMTPLGSFSKESHEEIGRFAIDFLDLLFVVGKEALPLFQEYQKSGKKAYYLEGQEGLYELLKQEIQEGDLVLFKGSRSNQLEKTIEKLCSFS